MTDALILKTKDYDFESFSHQGFGGRSKYIATSKKKDLPKLLIKHKGEFSPCCNGFIYGRLGQAMGVRVPQTFMMDVTKSDRHLFDSPCVVGMEYIDGLVRLEMERIRGNGKLEKELIDCFILFGLFTRFDDNMQCAYLPDEAVYPLDFDESFGLENGLFNLILRGDTIAEYLVHRSLNNLYGYSLNTYLNVSVKTAASELKMTVDAVLSIAVRTLRRFCELTEEEIESVTDALTVFFPPLLAAYYEEYIKILQEKARKYIQCNDSKWGNKR